MECITHFCVKNNLKHCLLVLYSEKNENNFAVCFLTILLVSIDAQYKYLDTRRNNIPEARFYFAVIGCRRMAILSLSVKRTLTYIKNKSVITFIQKNLSSYNIIMFYGDV